MASSTPSILWGEGCKRGWRGNRAAGGAGHSALSSRPASMDAATVPAMDCNVIILRRWDQQESSKVWRTCLDSQGNWSMGSTLHLAAMRRKQSQNSQLPTLLVSPDSPTGSGVPCKAGTSSENYLSLGLEQESRPLSLRGAARVQSHDPASSVPSRGQGCRLQGAWARPHVLSHTQNRTCGGRINAVRMEQMWNLSLRGESALYEW